MNIIGCVASAEFDVGFVAEYLKKEDEQMKNKRSIGNMMIPIFSLFISIISVYWTDIAWAGNNGWFTTYNSDIERGEIELMFMNDLTSPSKFKQEEDGRGDYFSHMIELEYGITDQLASEFMIEWFEDLKTSESKYTGFRWESRYRLFKEKVPLNPMIYAEFEDLDLATRYKMEVSGWVDPPYTEKGEEPDRERILESRMIISEDVGTVNLAFNWINETDLSGAGTAFGYSLGLMKMVHETGDSHREISSSVSSEHEHSSNKGNCKCESEMKGCRCSHCLGKGGECPCAHAGMVGIGIELFGALGDTKVFGFDLSRQEHYLGPIFMYHINSRWMFHSQLAIGLSNVSDNLTRLNFGYEF